MRSSPLYALWCLAISLVLVTQGALAAPTSPDQLITSLFNTSIERLRAEDAAIQKDRNRLVTLADEIVVPYVSFEKMAKQILGKNWRNITPDQQQRFTTAFKNRLATLLVEKYDPKKEWKLKITNTRIAPDGRIAVVGSEITDVTAAKVYAISYRFFKDPKADKWMVFDVIVEGISVLTSFQTACAEEYRKSGIESLIKQMETGELKTDSDAKKS
jgi:phospholipid transport system substrate-binding protein